MAQASQSNGPDPTRAAATPPLKPGLHFLSTPIGTAGDITLRGLAALREADALAAEDTRVLRRLMEIHGVALGERPMIAYHDHNAETARPKLLALLAGGARLVYASDAGAPMIADPGFKLAEAARAAGHAVSALPGPSAAIMALTLSGLPTDAFCFIGFPPAKSAARRRFFERWKSAPGSLVLFEGPRRLAESLADMAATLGPRQAAIARELTKRFEEVRRGALADLAAAIAEEGPPKGEITIVVGPPAPEVAGEAEIDALLRERLAEESVRDAVRTVMERLSVPRKIVYERALKIAEQEGCGDGE